MKVIFEINLWVACSAYLSFNNSESVTRKGVNYFCNKAPFQVFDRVLNTPLEETYSISVTIPVIF